MDKRYFIDLTSKLYRLTFFFPQKEPLRDRIRETGDEILADVIIILEGEIEEKKQASFKVEKNIKILDVLLELSKLQNWTEEKNVKTVQENYSKIRREVEELNEITKMNMKLLEPKKFLSEKVSSDYKQKEEERKPLKEQLYEEKTDNTSQSDRQSSSASEVQQKESQPKPPRHSDTPRHPDTPRRPDTPRHSERSEESQPESLSEKVKLNERQKKIIAIMKKGGKMQVQDIQPNFPTVTKRTLRRDLSLLLESNLIERIGKTNTTFYKVR